MSPRVYLFLQVGHILLQLVMSLPGTSAGSDPLTSLIVQPYMPKPNQLKTKKLLRRLGGHFNREFMSINKVSNATETTKTLNMDQHDIKAWLYRNIIENNGQRQDLVLDLIVKTLQRTSSCPIQYTWKDLGTLYFPRHIKTGSCLRYSSCSWPPGMMCKQSDVTTLRVLKWQCKRKRRGSMNKKKLNRTKGGKRNDAKIRLENNKVGKLKCNWKLIRYDVTTGCSCQC